MVPRSLIGGPGRQNRKRREIKILRMPDRESQPESGQLRCRAPASLWNWGHFGDGSGHLDPLAPHPTCACGASLCPHLPSAEAGRGPLGCWGFGPSAADARLLTKREGNIGSLHRRSGEPRPSPYTQDRGTARRTAWPCGDATHSRAPTPTHSVASMMLAELKYNQHVGIALVASIHQRDKSPLAEHTWGPGPAQEMEHVSIPEALSSPPSLHPVSEVTTILTSGFSVKHTAMRAWCPY